MLFNLTLVRRNTLIILQPLQLEFFDPVSSPSILSLLFIPKVPKFGIVCYAESSHSPHQPSLSTPPTYLDTAISQPFYSNTQPNLTGFAVITVSRPFNSPVLDYGVAKANHQGDGEVDGRTVRTLHVQYAPQHTDKSSHRVPGISAIPHEDNLRYFDVSIHGPTQSPYEGSKHRAQCTIQSF